jgi:hypothetical protein
MELHTSLCSICQVSSTATFPSHQIFSFPSLSIVKGKNYTIDPHIYGVNFPTSASYIQHLGVTISRWGGNAVTAYNPFGGFTNAGNDWYFENRASESADGWMGWVKGAGSDTLLTVPSYVSLCSSILLSEPFYSVWIGFPKMLALIRIPRQPTQVCILRYDPENAVYPVSRPKGIRSVQQQCW